MSSFFARSLPLAVVPILLAGCTTEQVHGFLPGFIEDEKPVTTNTQLYSDFWLNSWIVLVVVGILVWALTVVSAVMFRRRKDDTHLPRQVRYNMPAETLFTALPLILVLAFFVFSTRVSDRVDARVANPDVRIEAVGKQWAWDFNYLDSNVYYAGIQVQYIPGGGGAIDESKLPVLYLPVNKTTEIQLRSRDVVHSFWVVDFLYKRDMIPGRTNYMTVTPTREGEYMGKCAELCGEYHSAMLFKVKVVSQQEYDRYMQELADKKNIGRLGPDLDRNLNLPGTKAPENTEHSTEKKGH